LIATLIGCEGPWPSAWNPPIDQPPVALGAAAVMVDGCLHNAASGLGLPSTIDKAMAHPTIATLPEPVKIEVAEWRGLFAVLEQPLPDTGEHPMMWGGGAVARGECGEGRTRWALYAEYTKAQNAYFRARERHLRARIAELEKALDYYAAAVTGMRPQVVPSRVCLPMPVRGDGPFRSTFATAGDHDCQANQWGAVSVRATNGEWLGVKPSEFRVLVWRENKVEVADV
jgi:hypothetical protein